VIYLDSSVVLAWLFTEPRYAPDSIWSQPVASSRLLEYEVWNRIHARKMAHTLGDRTRSLMSRIEFTELTEQVLRRASEPFPIHVRTLDSLHLATVEYLRSLEPSVALASFDKRMLAAARARHIPLYEL
jgi:hypothetical protein